MNTGREGPRENCGLFGVYGSERAAHDIYEGLFALQHRGQEGAGITVCDADKKIRTIKAPGLLAQVFADRSPDELPGRHGIGHVRYSTTGSPRPVNVQPLVVECADGLWAIAHNGNLTNAGRLRRCYQQAGAIFQTGTDSEVLVHLLADPVYRNSPHHVERALNELAGAFAFLLMTSEGIAGARDRHGFRPLSIGKMPGGFALASETCALKRLGAEYLRDVRPGEVVTIDKDGMHSSRFCEAEPESSQCVFEHVYFARPDSIVFGVNVHQVRMRLGRSLARCNPVDADLVMAVPDSGNSAALGYSLESGIPLDYGFIRNHYIGRTFIMPDQNERGSNVDRKLAVIDSVVRGKRVVVVDDSLIRGTTSRRRIENLRAAGAREIHMRIGSPPARYPCRYGVDFPSPGELIAARKDKSAIAAAIGADSLAYVGLEGLLEAVGNGAGYCTACFSGSYPTGEGGQGRKTDLETHGIH